jgi:serine/threonine protein kinase
MNFFSQKYKLIKKIGQGQFGSVFLGQNNRTLEYVAIKKESVLGGVHLLKNESKILLYLSCKKQGIPEFKWFGIIEEHYLMVTTLLGHPLIAERVSSINNIAIQMIHILEYVHQKGIVHRDIKPEHFLWGQGVNKDKIYLVDFGFAKVYTNTNCTINNQHKIHTLIGTPNYASVYVHQGHEYTPYDDLESLVYVFMFLLNGSLPWSNYINIEEIIKYKNRTKNNNNKNNDLIYSSFECINELKQKNVNNYAIFLRLFLLPILHKNYT